ncbi:hypothetical protein PAAG_01204 [Paracoccidioides lutzii Pb01]|uniref:Uncharacterized protein n=1 Tax=Paracoccidioides lutzii (strain ATCC MYA-826 / Pb01) TaxID=502779 RepID=C1GRQ9_PARBA|nr:hypothetical protein PAAG_01204 [Paracoccidioides lutzii Pb01]EEH38283.1 hypothetical protein PAAG_01204 [Paracoccidioides lutzii Pb01]
MATIGQTIAVFDKSGKVVSTSKHLFGVFKEARSAYRERKAEIHAEKAVKNAELEARRALANYTIHDSRSVASSRRRTGRTRSVVRHGELDRHPARRYPHDVENGSPSTHIHPDQVPKRELSRRHTSHDVAVQRHQHHPGTRSHSTPLIDMNLAYGEYHPSSLERIRSPNSGKDVNGLVAKAKDLLVEAKCAQHSVQATMAHLQKNPEAMAAVALTLAEISNLVSKLAPGALAALKSSAPAVFALLSSPQFMIAAGVGVGVTIVMFGGYKIVKRLTAGSAEPEGSTDELIELNQNLSRVETWRRGVADYEAESVATSVDGEFITPRAAAVSGIFPHCHASHLRSEYGGRRSVRGVESIRDTSSKYSNTTRSSRRSRRAKELTDSGDKDRKDKKRKDKTKKPSPLRLLFKPSK